MSWLLHLSVDGSEQAEAVSVELWDHGTTGVAEVATDGGLELIAGFEDETTARQAAGTFGGEVRPVDPPVWASTVTTHVSFGDHSMVLDASTAFGHGEHPTTRLVLDAMTAFILETKPQSLLDVGSGTGVLAIAGAKLGVTSVVAIDNDPAAVTATIANSEANGVANLIRAGESLTSLDSGFDLVVANLLLADLRSVAADIARLVGQSPGGGSVIASGFLSGQVDEVVALLHPLRTIRSTSDGDWVCLILTHTSAPTATR